MHAIGHIAANLSFAAVAISLTHTVKTLEPAFNVILAKLILGEATPLPAMLSLIPIMVGSCSCQLHGVGYHFRLCPQTCHTSSEVHLIDTYTDLDYELDSHSRHILKRYC